MGVAVPFPGTPLYDDYPPARTASRTGGCARSTAATRAFPPIDDCDRFYRHYIDDANLELDFFRYSRRDARLIRECLRFKGEHNLRRMGLLRDPVFAPTPVRCRPQCDGDAADDRLG